MNETPGTMRISRAGTRPISTATAQTMNLRTMNLIHTKPIRAKRRTATAAMLDGRIITTPEMRSATAAAIRHPAEITAPAQDRVKEQPKTSRAHPGGHRVKDKRNELLLIRAVRTAFLIYLTKIGSGLNYMFTERSKAGN
jgi:hypothetical protein